MGLFTRFRKVDDSIQKVDSLKHNILKSFINLRNDLDNQNKWINYLYKSHTDVKSDHKSHRYDLKVQLNNINQWIDYLHENSKCLGKRVKGIEQDIKNALDTYNRHIIELYKISEKFSNIQQIDEHKLKSSLRTMVSLDVKNELREAMLKEVKERIKGEIGQLAKELTGVKEQAEKALHAAHNPHHEQEAKIVETLVKEPELRYTHALLTNPEQKLLNILFNEENPVSYDKITRATGQSVNTVRVNMNSLKKKGLIEENLLPTGIKLFSLKNKERIKKIYNLEVIH